MYQNNPKLNFFTFKHNRLSVLEFVHPLKVCSEITAKLHDICVHKAKYHIFSTCSTTKANS